ncbi:MAG TPA: hypothetical protein VKB86_10240 [Pyrinomonadaceae bacterium]|nr:hypothetical protein [Pyrinomonadaceae bacterium]
MKIIGGNRFALQCDNNEEITVNVTSKGTVFLVTYIVKNGKVIGGPNQGHMTQGVPLKFRIDNSSGNRNNLNLGFTFASPAHATGQPVTDDIEYDVEITSNAAGSDVSKEFISGSFGIPGDNRQWRFFIN